MGNVVARKNGQCSPMRNKSLNMSSARLKVGKNKLANLFKGDHGPLQTPKTYDNFAFLETPSHLQPSHLQTIQTSNKKDQSNKLEKFLKI